MMNALYDWIGLRKKVSLNNVVVIGDSHARSFSGNGSFSPFFVGPGKEFNFLDERASKRIKKAIERIVDATTNRYFLLVFGEPDTRFLLGKGWHPWQVTDSMEHGRYHPEGIGTSSENYLGLLSGLSSRYASREFFVLNATPSRRDMQNRIVCALNEKLELGIAKARWLNIFFVSINQFVMSEENLPKEEFINEEDPVHLNHNVQPLVEQYFLDRGVLQRPLLLAVESQDGSEAQGIFKFDKRFGCYVVDR